METVNIFGRTYRIEYGSAPPGDGAMGRSLNMMQILWVNKDMPEEMRDSTLIHEVLHSVSDSLCLELTEAQVTALETALFSLGFRVQKIQIEEE